MLRSRSYVKCSVALFLSLLVAGSMAVTARAETTLFTSDLSSGDTGPQVQQLQVFLNTHGFPLAESGIGSSGQETDSFGTLTKNAVEAFQTAHALPATGYFGPHTRALVNSLIMEVSHDAQSIATTSAPDTATTTTPAWIAAFNEHAPSPGWIPGFGGGGGGQVATQSSNPEPVISDVASTTLALRATVTWTTDELSDSEVVYSTDTSYSSSAYDPTMTTSHSITITGLTMGTIYHFEVVSTDAASSTATSTDQTFKTKIVT